MSLFKFASVAVIALTLGACQSLFQPNYRVPLEVTRDTSEQLKPGCTSADCPLVNIDTLRFPGEPALDGIVEKRLLQMTRTSPDAPLPASLSAYREQFLRTGGGVGRHATLRHAAGTAERGARIDRDAPGIGTQHAAVAIPQTDEPGERLVARNALDIRLGRLGWRGRFIDGHADKRKRHADLREQFAAAG